MVDRGSLQQPKSEDYHVDGQLVKLICQKLEVTPDVDAFSKLATRRFPRFWGPDSPEIEDAFRRSWSDDVIWANPPFSRLKDVVWKWQEDQAHGIIIAPKWPTAIWFEDLMSMVIRGLVFPGG
eukprot:EG_transcript_45239